jgi:perosamine synthetase
MIRWNSPKFGTKELELVKEVLESGYASEGPKTKELEERLSKIVNAKHVIMTTSATAALYLAIEADKRIYGYDKGNVIIPNLTFIATKNAVEMAGLKPRIMDVDQTKSVLRNIMYDKKTRVIIPVNLLGRSAGQFEIIPGRCEATLIYDNAGCLGSIVPNGKVGCYSLQANKLLTCGQGGFCATDDDEYAEVIRQLKDFGREDKDDQHTQGFNFKFNDIQAAVALGQLELLEERKMLHAAHYCVYAERLSGLGKFMPFNIRFKEGKTTWEVPLWVEFFPNKKSSTIDTKYSNTTYHAGRDELFYYLKERGIEARKPWLPLVDNPERYPNTDYYCKNCIWLPNGASLTPKDQEEVIKVIKDFYASI